MVAWRRLLALKTDTLVMKSASPPSWLLERARTSWSTIGRVIQ